MNFPLRRTLAVLLTGSAATLAATSASAISVTDLGTMSGEISTSATVPQYAWDGWNGLTANLGWAHNSQWYTFTLEGRTTVQITMSSADANMYPAFSVWQTNGNFNGNNHLNHAYNQVSLSKSSKWLKPTPPNTDGATAFIGYANAGTNFTNGDGAHVGRGSSGISSRNGNASRLAVTLAAGQYLIAAGGSCNAANCGSPSPKPFTLKFQKLPFKP
ncbi:hypothetical protein [Methylotetracoccus oryzae]|uniref:hypothetical protein n=1 Tax=Methylotetracoccus oryzae TaxID=1919059 RepID=UPI001117ECA8|nr:hypothetical protein [Methylotetracoccus oryzae]